MRFFSSILLVFLLSSCAEGLEMPENDQVPPEAPPDGKVTLPSYFSDGIVLQRSSDVKIFGQTESNGKVRILCSWSELPVEGTSDSNGNFSIAVRTPEAGGPYTISVNETVINDVMIGEVWLASGQSNMSLTLANTDMEGLSGENNPDIRVFTVPVRMSDTPITDLENGQWSYGPVDKIKNNTTAVGYYFARKLQKELKIPIGVICSSKGGTGAEEWMSTECFNSLPAEIQKTFPATEKRWGGCRFNAMINPIKDCVFKGTIWYQGENNVPRGWAYDTVLKALINDWRGFFSNQEMPFYIVQLPSYSKSGWRELRAKQEKAVDGMDNCAYVCTIDQGEATNVHPTNKIHVGERLAELALSNEYGVSSYRKQPPRVDSYKSEGNSIIVSFKNVTKLSSADGTDIGYFEVCGEDEIYHPAKATIKGDSELTVSSTEEEKPVKVRYYWTNYGKPNLIDNDGWPIAPFYIENESQCLSDNLFDESTTESINDRYAVSKPFIYDEWVSVNAYKEQISFHVADDADRGAVAAMKTDVVISNKYPFRGFLTQRLSGTLEPGLYELSFYTKTSDAESMCRVFVHCTDENGDKINKWFARYPDSGNANTVYCSNSKITSADGWTRFSYVFDLGKTVSTTSSINYVDAANSTEVDLTDVLVCLQNGTMGTTLFLDEISFAPYEP